MIRWYKTWKMRRMFAKNMPKAADIALRVYSPGHPDPVIYLTLADLGQIIQFGGFKNREQSLIHTLPGHRSVDQWDVTAEWTPS